MDATPLTRRRWFRFSLRTMFVLVTVIAIFVGYHVNWIRQRNELRADQGMDLYPEKVSSNVCFACQAA